MNINNQLINQLSSILILHKILFETNIIHIHITKSMHII